jgi:ribose transport system permease protein
MSETKATAFFAALPLAARPRADGAGAQPALRSFPHPDNGWNILRQISVNLCLSIGMTLVILSGGIDLSVGAILGLAGAVAPGLLKTGIGAWHGHSLQFTPSGAILAGIAVGAAAGWINGFAITRFKLPPFVATLGMFSIARGLTMLWTGGFPVTGLGDASVFSAPGCSSACPRRCGSCSR